MTMTRDELRGKQTPGEAHVVYGPLGSWEIENYSGGHAGGLLVLASRANNERITEQQYANAALYAEAHNVANRTGMWPEDLVARVKELEEVVAHAHRVMLYRGWHTLARPSLEADAWDAVESAHRATINKPTP